MAQSKKDERMVAILEDRTIAPVTVTSGPNAATATTIVNSTIASTATPIAIATTTPDTTVPNVNTTTVATDGPNAVAVPVIAAVPPPGSDSDAANSTVSPVAVPATDPIGTESVFLVEFERSLSLSRQTEPLMQTSLSLTLTATEKAALVSLSTASPQSLASLVTLGESVHTAETEYALIRERETDLWPYYLCVLQSLSGTVSAVSALRSGLVAASKGGTMKEQCAAAAASLLSATSLPGSSIAAAVISYSAQCSADRDRERLMHALTHTFPQTARTHACIESLCRRLSLAQCDALHALVVGDKETDNQKSLKDSVTDALTRLRKSVEWLKTGRCKSDIEELARTHAALIINHVIVNYTDKDSNGGKCLNLFILVFNRFTALHSTSVGRLSVDTILRRTSP